jgi:photosystem II stability/assembly factor-like uncharacterized protein
LRGKWHQVYSLTGGQVLLVWADDSRLEHVYAVANGDPDSVEGSSFLALRDRQWDLRARDFSKALPTAITENPDGIFIAFYGEGIRRSQDGGQNWLLMNRGLPARGLTSLISDPTRPHTLYAGTSDFWGVLRSTNSGDSWATYGYTDTYMYGAQITSLACVQACNEGMLLAGTADGRILGHHQAGGEWGEYANPARGAITAIATSRSTPTRIYATTNRGFLLRSDDSGETWSLPIQIGTQFQAPALIVDPSDPDHLLAGTYGNGGYTVWESRDGGNDWLPTAGTGLPRSEIFSLTFVGYGKLDLLSGSAEGLFRSTDSAQTWASQTLSAPLGSVQDLAVGDHASAPIYALRASSVHSNLQGDLQDWKMGQGIEAAQIRALEVDPDAPNVAYVGGLLLGSWTFFKTQDGGLTWQRTPGPEGFGEGLDVASIAIFPRNKTRPSILYIGSIGCGVFRSTDEGQTWDSYGRNNCDEDTSGNMPADVTLLAVDAQNENLLYAGSGQKLARSLDGGKTWVESDLSVESPIRRIKTDPVNANTAYVIAGSDGFWRTQDGGSSWTQLGGEWLRNAELIAIETVPDVPGEIMVGATNGGIWSTTDGGVTWMSKRENLTVSAITSIATSTSLNGTVLIGSPSEGIARFTPGQIFSSSTSP